MQLKCVIEQLFANWVNVYRKPTHNDTYINNNAFNPKAHKFAAFNSMIYRMIRLPLNDENRKNEKRRILQIAQRNDFKEEEMLMLIGAQEYKQKVKRVTTLEADNDEREFFAPFPYHPKFNNKF